MDRKWELPGLAQEVGSQRRGLAPQPEEAPGLSQELVQAQQEAYLSIAKDAFNRFYFWMCAVRYGNTHVTQRVLSPRSLPMAVKLNYHSGKFVMKLIPHSACVCIA